MILLEFNNPYWKNDHNKFVKLFWLCKDHPRSYFNIIRSKKSGDPDLVKWIDECVKSKLSDPIYKISTKCNWIIHGIEDFPLCETCHKNDNYKLKNLNVNDKYSRFCSYKCEFDSEWFHNKTMTEESRRKLSSSLKVSFSQKSDEWRKDFSEGCRRRTLKSYKEKKDEIMERRKRTMRKNYGVDWYFQTDEAKEHTVEMNIERFGSEYYFNSEQRKINYSDPMYVESITRKQQESKKKNGSYKKSEPEDNAYGLLKSVFPDIIRQYYSDEYPFNADFYDPHQPHVRFEFQGTWTHGKHAFDENNVDDQNLVTFWKSKNTKYFDNAIDTWTRRDVIKRNTAKNNGIVLIEFWCINDVKKFISDYLQSK